jgi:hypothetical protein
LQQVWRSQSSIQPRERLASSDRYIALGISHRKSKAVIREPTNMKFFVFPFICPPLLTAIVMASINSLSPASNNQCAQPGSLPPSLSNDFAELDSNSESIQHIMVSEFSPPPIQHDLVLARGKKNSEIGKTYKSLIANFRANDRCEVVRHVRSVTVKDAVPFKDLLLVLNTISSCGGNLQTLQ